MVFKFMEWKRERSWVKGTTPKDIAEGVMELYGGQFISKSAEKEIGPFKNELVKYGFVSRQVGNGPRLHDGLITRVAWLTSTHSYFALLVIDVREWLRQQENTAKGLINPTAQPTP